MGEQLQAFSNEDGFGAEPLRDLTEGGDIVFGGQFFVAGEATWPMVDGSTRWTGVHVIKTRVGNTRVTDGVGHTDTETYD